MAIDKSEWEAFGEEYKQEEQEILVLFSDQGGGAGKAGGDLWSASAYFLAYQDPRTGEVKQGDGRVAWPLTDEDRKRHGTAYPYFFKRGGIYRLRVRDLIDRRVPPGRLPSFYNRFLVVEVLEENAKSDALTALLEEYRRPVVLEGGALGNFTLNKDYARFEGSVTWRGRECSVHLEVDRDDPESWTAALHNLRALWEGQEEQDGAFRQFAAASLTELANDWLEDEEAGEITSEAFAGRICLMDLAVDAGGRYTAYYNDDDMFYGHCVTVYGSVAGGPERANMEG